MEPTTALGGGLAIWGTKELMVKLLGPTADYLGHGLKDYTQKGSENVVRILRIAIRNLGSRVEQPGQVPPKVLKEVLNHGYVCEDELAAEYFGGVLASSRTEIGRDDRGATIIALIGRLSSYQIRSHYLFYRALKAQFAGANCNPGMSDDRAALGIFVPRRSFYESMGFGFGENESALVPHIMNGLSREELINSTWFSGDPINLEQFFQFRAPENGLFWTPSATGLELFMWAHGVSDRPIRDFLRISYPPIAGIAPLKDTIGTGDKKREWNIRPIDTNGSVPSDLMWGE